MAGSSTTGGESLKLSKVLSEKYKDLLLTKCPRHQLLNVADDVIVAWSKEDGCLLSQLVTPSDSKVQTLALSKPPVWEVEQIQMNKNGNCVALIGRRGVAVVELPHRSGDPPLYDRGRDTITCRVEYVAARFFSCHPKVEVLAAAWHPGSLDNNHIVILASDNYLRIFNLSSNEIPEQAISVGSVKAGVISSSNFTCTSTLGENAVAFDFSLPSEPMKYLSGNPVSNGVIENLIDRDDEKRQSFLALQWPVFILYGNGDIYFTITMLGTNRPHLHKLHGPLSMTPACDDNYGLDSCSLLVLQSSPPVLVIATTTGQLHHCIVVDNDLNEDTGSLLQNNMSNYGSQSGVPAAVKLHVYETVELELSLVPDDEGFTAPLSLHPDPSTPTSHEAGVHGVTVPIIEHLLQYTDLPDDAAFSSSESLCMVDHLVCTRSLTAAGPMPVVGLVANSTHNLYVLLASGRIISIGIPAGFTPLVMDPPHTDYTLALSPLRKIHTENFEDHIRSILHRLSSQPLLASGSNSEVTPGEYLNLLNRITATLRTNYMQPQRAARVDIQRRSDILIEQKQRLQAEIDDLQSRKKLLTEKAHDLAERYEESNDKKIHLVERIERVLSRVMRALPMLSRGEKNMKHELDSMQSHISSLMNELTQIKAKDKWQTNQKEKFQNTEASKNQRVSSVSENQLKALKQALTIEGEKLSILVERVNQVKHDLQL
ncbi:Nuclear pore complex protein Nup88-like [Homarus americanus]|uniref:Nuclear pore complex protein Nup88-like n=1 Tax=Homarus americanus TaxID=6706 RepID=A0A8J5JHP9_HOMAM|nr:Nuclear pore complex protein Nup88-like [Homarus americanus]